MGEAGAKITGEWVLAAPAAGLLAGRPLQGVAAGGAAWLAFLLAPANTRFLPRAPAEQDPGWKQIIPYVILRAGREGASEVFCYRRGATGGEARLRALRSVGLGGHINPGDEGLFAAAGWAAYRAAVERELGEEVEIGAPVLQRRIVGVLNDDTSAVGRVHVGIIEIWDLAAPRVCPRERKIADPGFRSLALLRQEAETLGREGPDAGGWESWSRFCLAAWEELAAQPGWTPPAPRADVQFWGGREHREHGSETL